MRSLLVLAVLVVTSAEAADAKFYKRDDGARCVLTVGPDNQLKETCESPAQQSAGDAPRAQLAPPSPSLVPALAKPVEMDALTISLLGRASLKHGWSGALKIGAISNALLGLINLGAGYSTSGLLNLAGSAIFLLIGILVDVSAADDLAMASGEKPRGW